MLGGKRKYKSKKHGKKPNRPNRPNRPNKPNKPNKHKKAKSLNKPKRRKSPISRSPRKAKSLPKQVRKSPKEVRKSPRARAKTKKSVVVKLNRNNHQNNHNNENNRVNNMPSNNNGHHVKRIISQRMISEKSKDGKKTAFVDIFSAVKKDDKSRLLRHMRVSKNGKRKMSTVLAKSNAKHIKVLESVHNGVSEKQRKFTLNNPDSLKNVLSVQSQKINGTKVINNFNLKKSRSVNDNNGENNLRKSKGKPRNVARFISESLKKIMAPKPHKRSKSRKKKRFNDLRKIQRAL
jgi:hypothetical protein